MLLSRNSPRTASYQSAVPAQPFVMEKYDLKLTKFVLHHHLPEACTMVMTHQAMAGPDFCHQQGFTRGDNVLVSMKE